MLSHESFDILPKIIINFAVNYGGFILFLKILFSQKIFPGSKKPPFGNSFYSSAYYFHDAAAFNGHIGPNN